MISRSLAKPHQAIRASAGSGKTYQLTNRYLALLLAGESVERIVAMTFTRKAAGEISERLLTRLASAALDPARCAALARDLNDPSFGTARAGELLTSVVSQLHRLRVFTIDAFFAGIAASFALDIGLPMNWTLAEPDVDQRLRDEALTQTLRGEPERVIDLMAMLNRGHFARAVSERLDETIASAYEVFLESTKDAWQTLARPPGFDALEVARRIEELSAEVTGSAPLDEAIRRIVHLARVRDFAGVFSETLAKNLLRGERTYLRRPVPDALADSIDKLLTHAKSVVAQTLADQTEATYALLHQFDQRYQRLKLTRGALRFDDISRALADAALLERLDEVSFRLDGQIAHLLLDEFQDTSRTQWSVLKPFAREVVSYADASHSLFVVGDAKQAIYGWRGGESAIFRELDSDLPGLDWQPLDVSYRSAQTIIDTMNWVFGEIDTNPALSKRSHAALGWRRDFARHTTARSEVAGYARLETAPRAQKGESQARRTLVTAAEHVAALVHDAPNASIAVLVRQNRAIAHIIAELKRRGIAASEEGGNPLTDSPAVTLITSILLLADHPGDTAARFHVARSALGAEIGFVQFQSDEAAVRTAMRVRADLADSGYGPIVREWAEVLAKSCGPRDARRLAQLVRVAHAYDRAATLRPSEFVARVRTQRMSDPSPGYVRVMTIHQAKGLEFDAVVLPDLDGRLHGNAPVVLTERDTPTAPPSRVVRHPNERDRAAFPDLQALYDANADRTLTEALSVLYVALTRSARALFMVVAPARETEQTPPYTLAGILRGALAARKPAPPGATLYEHGDREWYGGLPVASLPTAEGRVVQIAVPETPASRHRVLPRMSPSKLEGGTTQKLKDRLRLDPDAGAARGTILHAFFERIEWLENGMPDDASLRAIALREGASTREADELVSSFHSMLDHTEIARALHRATYEADGHRAQAFRELPFAVREGEGILTGSIDRLVLRRDLVGAIVDAEVLDFKSDVTTREGLKAKIDLYAPQLRAYQRAVERLFRLEAPQVRAKLLFVRPGRVIDV